MAKATKTKSDLSAAASAEASEQTRPTRIQLQNRSKVMQAATAVFAQYGYRGATIDQIAVEAAMSKANLLYYYRSKRELYLAVLESIMSRWLAPLEDLQEDLDPVAELTSYIEIKLKFSRTHPQASKVWANEIISGAEAVRPMLQTALRDIVARKSAVLTAWQKKGLLGPIYPEHLIFMIWAVTQTYADFSSQIDAVSGKTIKDKAFYQQAVENTKQILFYGILPRR